MPVLNTPHIVRAFDPKHLSLIRRLKRSLRLRGDARNMPSLAVPPVYQSRVLRHTVVPHDHCALLPLNAHVEIGAIGDVVVKELEQIVRFFLLQADDITRDCSPCVSEPRCLEEKTGSKR